MLLQKLKGKMEAGVLTVLCVIYIREKYKNTGQQSLKSDLCHSFVTFKQSYMSTITFPLLYFTIKLYCNV